MLCGLIVSSEIESIGKAALPDAMAVQVTQCILTFNGDHTFVQLLLHES